MSPSRVWYVLLGLNVVAAVVAVGVARWHAEPSWRTPITRHLKATGYGLAPCGDMYKGCVSEWRPSGALRLSLDTSPDFPAGNVLKLEKSVPGDAEIALPLRRCQGRVGLLSRFRREGPVDGEMGLRRGRGWRSFGKLSWKPSGFPLWASEEGVVALPLGDGEAEFVFRLRGTGRVWLQQTRLRSEP